MRKLLLVTVLLHAFAARADTPGECIAAEGAKGEAACYAVELSRLDSVMKEKYRKSLKVMLTDLTAGGRSLESIEQATKGFSEAQHLWEKYRDAYCKEYVGASADAANASMETARCQVRLTGHRVKDLGGED